LKENENRLREKARAVVYGLYDSKIDLLSILIGDDRANPLQPPASMNGHLDWPAVWRLARATAESAS
jgi:hypothetical protein